LLGGHHIDHCDVFDTVKRPATMAPSTFGSRSLVGVKGLDLDTVLQALMQNSRAGCRRDHILSNSRWRCDHGWDIDLDDGSTNYTST